MGVISFLIEHGVLYNIFAEVFQITLSRIKNVLSPFNIEIYCCSKLLLTIVVFQATSLDKHK